MVRMQPMFQGWLTGVLDYEVDVTVNDWEDEIW